jgi:sulfatase modifying factor 1
MSFARTGALLMALMTVGCSSELPPLGQVVLLVDTDAPLATSDRLSIDDPIPLFDRIRFDVYPPGADEPCGGCGREFALTEATMLAREASIGVKPSPHTSGYRVRIRIFRFDYVQDGEPVDRTALDAVVELPTVDDERIIEGHVFMPTDLVGQPLGTPSQPIPMAAGTPEVSRVGTWPHAHRVPCDGQPQQDEACVPGGAFWMGHPAVPGGLGRDDRPAPRLAVVKPFFIDKAEFSVGQTRAWLMTHDPTWDPDGQPDPVPASDQSLRLDVLCTLPVDRHEDSSDSLPINCLTHERARMICDTRNSDHPADLPSEAQLEYVGRALENAAFPWGNDEPECSDAVFAQAGSETYFEGFPAYCREAASIGGPRRIGWGDLDRVTIAGAEIVDLGGNLAELARDAWSPQAEPCLGPTLSFEPLCEDPGQDQLVIRGGSWASAAYELRGPFRGRAAAAFEFGLVDTKLGPHIGFRCARPATAGKP